MSWYNPGSFNPFQGMMNGSNGGIDPVSNPIVSDSSPSGSHSSVDAMSYDLDGIISQLEKKASNGDISALESLFNYRKDLDDRTYKAQREDTVYQRLMDDLKKAGISPYMLTGATPPSISNSTLSSGSQMSTQENSRRTAEQNEKDLAGNMLKAILTFAGTALMAMAFL